MKKLKNFWARIPRPCRVLWNLAAAFAIAAVFYVSIGSPAFSAEHAFRRAERANFVGPSEILFNEETENYLYDHLILAETEQGVITYATDENKSASFNYFKKTGAITVVSAPKYYPFYWGLDNLQISLPVFVVDDYPEAVYAELEICVKGVQKYNLNGESYTEILDQSFTAESHREKEGYFRFSLDLPFIYPLDKDGNRLDVRHGPDGFALDILAYCFTNAAMRDFDADIFAAVRLYAADGTLLTEQAQTLQPNTRFWE